MNMRVVAVDDEPLALLRLEVAMQQIEGIELVGQARRGKEALQIIAATQPDVVLLDIKMAGMSGFDIVEALAGPNIPLVIFVTAYDSFAVRAFEAQAVDYIMKPVEFDRLAKALDRARQLLEANDRERRLIELNDIVAKLRSATTGTSYDTEFWTLRRGEFVRVAVGNIDWIEAERDYVHLHAGGESYLLRKTMESLEERLDPEMFLRVRRSALVQRKCVETIRYRSSRDVRVVLTSGEEVRVGRTYLPRIRDLIAGRAGAAPVTAADDH